MPEASSSWALHGTPGTVPARVGLPVCECPPSGLLRLGRGRSPRLAVALPRAGLVIPEESERQRTPGSVCPSRPGPSGRPVPAESLEVLSCVLAGLPENAWASQAAERLGWWAASCVAAGLRVSSAELACVHTSQLTQLG